MTKQAMAELVLHLETNGYVARTPNPTDRRSKLVIPTDRGIDVVSIAQSVVPEAEALVERAVGERRMATLRRDLERILMTAERSS